MEQENKIRCVKCGAYNGEITIAPMKMYCWHEWEKLPQEEDGEKKLQRVEGGGYIDLNAPQWRKKTTPIAVSDWEIIAAELARQTWFSFRKAGYATHSKIIYDACKELYEKTVQRTLLWALDEMPGSGSKEAVEALNEYADRIHAYAKEHGIALTNESKELDA